MARNRPKISFGKAQSTPSKRTPPGKGHKVLMNKPGQRSEILDYVERMRERTGISTLDLIRRFQEKHCDHLSTSQLARSPGHIVTVCNSCRLVQ